MSTLENMLIVARSQSAEPKQKEAVRQQLIHMAYLGTEVPRDIVATVAGDCPCKRCEFARIQAIEKKNFKRTVLPRRVKLA